MGRVRRAATYQATIHETPLGSVRVSYGQRGPHVFIVGSQECTHHLFPDEAREVAAAILAVAAEAEQALADEVRAAP